MSTRDTKRFFKALLDAEEDVQNYVLEPGSIPRLSTSFLASIDLSALKATILRSKSGSPSIAEASALDAIFKFDAIVRDFSMRKKGRLDYYSEASEEYENEKLRLRGQTISTTQNILGNSSIQRGGSI